MNEETKLTWLELPNFYHGIETVIHYLDLFAKI
jgi:hypothetical protein